MNLTGKCFAILLVMVCALNSAVLNVDSKELPTADLIEIIRSEDELRYDLTLERLLESDSAETRVRAALAAGRIGDEKALPLLIGLLNKRDTNESQMAAFAIGEIESIKATEQIISILWDSRGSGRVRTSVIEAAGKIAAANAETEESQLLGKAILANLEFEAKRGSTQSPEVVLRGITAALRAKPDGADKTVAKFLSNRDPRIRADAANVIARLGSKLFNQELKSMLVSDGDAVSRANAARALGAAQDGTAVELLMSSAVLDRDQRVRVGAIGALGRINEGVAAKDLLDFAENLLQKFKASKYANPPEINELLVISAALGNLSRGTDDAKTVKFLDEFRNVLKNSAPEVELALIRVSPTFYARQDLPVKGNWRATSAVAQAFGSVAALEDSESVKLLKSHALAELKSHLDEVLSGGKSADLAFPDVLTAFAAFKQADLTDVLYSALKQDDVIIRATAARLMGEISGGNAEAARARFLALEQAFQRSENDLLNDASIASLDGLKKIYLNSKDDENVKIDIEKPLRRGLASPDYLVRRKTREIAKETGIGTGPSEVLVDFEEKGVSRVKRVDYAKAVQRKKASAVLTTLKGSFTISFFPSEAPLTVDNFINLANAGYFNNLEIHRVVPNFVVQDGDPRGDGSGGPGWQIRCEINQIPYERGTVGMALSGKDTGGSQWFVAHSPQPHLDGGYSVFGKVNETGMKVVDKLVRGDVIKTVRIVEGK